jgi:hypothetical protein
MVSMTRRKILTALPTTLYVLALVIGIINVGSWLLFSNAEYVIYPLMIGDVQLAVWWISIILIVAGAALHFVLHPQ